ncbi:SGNH/GDSL hydrolase family protein [Lunatibacter salilacus]|uniref:hypothetical protein n=1 Tax=Lunatibacter salilacus TaxID=2483804 RepID=UPI00131D86B9|nr:hypothetical protein [Lunatibacter salilacus]
MKIFVKITFGILGILLLSCSDQDENQQFRKDISVLIVGNSILQHAPAPNIGWYGDWGMAASAPEKDFYRIYSKLLTDSGKYTSVEVDAKNIGHWEVDFTYDLNQYVDISSKSYDVFIVRLGENVGNTDEYYSALTDMINHFKHSETKVIITGMVWEHLVKESIQQQVADDNDYLFVPTTDFHHNLSYFSFDLFENREVAGHPSDLGMQNIAELLYNATIEAL